ncbi:MAG TPA: thioredoxin domain-containing protein [Candidatus Limnocylindrales bacterium]
MPNRLAGETSPYLLQHAHNPVEWQPWDAAALRTARDEQKPIFLSVGYAACHWCHVMERESFEDAATAAQLNRDFVAIKVDREERPDIDAVYMAGVQAMTGGGGWPMSVFLTPDGRPFYGGTYFPDTPRHGMPAFRQVLAAVAQAWRERRAEVEASAERLAAALAAQVRGETDTAPRDTAAAPATETGPAEDGAAAGGAAKTGGDDGSAGDDRPSGARPTPTERPGLALGLPDTDRLDGDLLRQAVLGLERSFDPVHGGWGGAPKFPQAMVLEALLRRAVGTGDETERRRALAMARRTLDAMADGGIHDQLGGGFHRYATDAVWLVPHFEKMLYDNAQLARVYLHAWQLTDEPRYRDVADRTLDYLAREMTTPEGGLAASQDADTDGVEGATHLWTRDEVVGALGGEAAARAGLGDDAAALFCEAYGVTGTGNWEGRTVLSRVRSDAELAALHGLADQEVARRLDRARTVLLARRSGRRQPARDDKVLASWNGLAIAAFAEAAPVLGRPADLAVATRAAEAILRLQLGPDGRLHRSYRDGRASADGVLEDHTHLADGLLALYEATFDERWFLAARELMDGVLRRFTDDAGGWFDTPDDGERLFLRPKDLQDNAVPSGNAMAATVLLRLYALTGEGRLRHAAERALALVRPYLTRYPTGFGQWLVALDLSVARTVELAIIGDPVAPDTRALLVAARAGFRPHQVLAVSDDPGSSAVELLQARFALGGRATAFVCHDFACRQPVTEPEALAAYLAGEATSRAPS